MRSFQIRCHFNNERNAYGSRYMVVRSIIHDTFFSLFSKHSRDFTSVSLSLFFLPFFFLYLIFCIHTFNEGHIQIEVFIHPFTREQLNELASFSSTSFSLFITMNYSIFV